MGVENITPVAPSDYDITPRTPAQVAPFETPWREAEFGGICDGDTLRLKVDLGLECVAKKKFRLIGLKCGIEDKRLGIDTWETKGETKPMGEAALKRAANLIGAHLERTPGFGLRILTGKTDEPDGAYGRWLGCILVFLPKGFPFRLSGELEIGEARPIGPEGFYSLGDILLAEGHARVWWPGIAKQLEPLKSGAARPKAKKAR